MSKPFIPWCFQNYKNAVNVIWIAAIFIATCTLFLNVMGIIKLTRLKKFNSTLSRMYLVITFLFTASNISYTIHTGQSILCSNISSWTNCGVIAMDCYMAGLSFLYLLYFCRLRSTFQTTKYSVSKLICSFCFVGFIVQLTTITLATFFLMQNNLEIGLKAYSMFNVINFIFNIFLLITFASKIYNLSKKTILKSTQSRSIQSMSNTHSIYKYKKDLNNSITLLLTPTVRNIICAFISLLSSNLLSVFGVIRSSDGFDSELLRTLHIFLIICDIGINSYFLYLQYPFGDTLYTKCCHKLHSNIHNKMIKKIDNDNDHSIINSCTSDNKNNMKKYMSDTTQTVTTTNDVTSSTVTNIGVEKSNFESTDVNVTEFHSNFEIQCT